MSDTITITVTDVERLDFGLRSVAEDTVGVDLCGLTVDDLDEYIDALTDLRNAMSQLEGGAKQITAQREYLSRAGEALIESGQAQMDHADNPDDRNHGRGTRDLGYRLLSQLGEAATV